MHAFLCGVAFNAFICLLSLTVGPDVVRIQDVPATHAAMNEEVDSAGKPVSVVLQEMPRGVLARLLGGLARVLGAAWQGCQWIYPPGQESAPVDAYTHRIVLVEPQSHKTGLLPTLRQYLVRAVCAVLNLSELQLSAVLMAMILLLALKAKLPRRNWIVGRKKKQEQPANVYTTSSLWSETCDSGASPGSGDAPRANDSPDPKVNSRRRIGVLSWLFSTVSRDAPPGATGKCTTPRCSSSSLNMPKERREICECLEESRTYVRHQLENCNNSLKLVPASQLLSSICEALQLSLDTMIARVKSHETQDEELLHIKTYFFQVMIPAIQGVTERIIAVQNSPTLSKRSMLDHGWKQESELFASKEASDFKSLQRHSENAKATRNSSWSSPWSLFKKLLFWRRAKPEDHDRQAPEQVTPRRELPKDKFEMNKYAALRGKRRTNGRDRSVGSCPSISNEGGSLPSETSAWTTLSTETLCRLSQCSTAPSLPLNKYLWDSPTLRASIKSIWPQASAPAAGTAQASQASLGPNPRHNSPVPREEQLRKVQEANARLGLAAEMPPGDMASRAAATKAGNEGGDICRAAFPRNLAADATGAQSPLTENWNTEAHRQAPGPERDWKGGSKRASSCNEWIGYQQTVPMAQSQTAGSDITVSTESGSRPCAPPKANPRATHPSQPQATSQNRPSMNQGADSKLQAIPHKKPIMKQNPGSKTKATAQKKPSMKQGSASKSREDRTKTSKQQKVSLKVSSKRAKVVTVKHSTGEPGKTLAHAAKDAVKSADSLLKNAEAKISKEIFIKPSDSKSEPSRTQNVKTNDLTETFTSIGDTDSGSHSVTCTSTCGYGSEETEQVGNKKCEFAGFILLEWLRDGQFADVYFAQDKRTLKDCYMKALKKAKDEEFLQRYNFTYNRHQQLMIMDIAEGCVYCTPLYTCMETRNYLYLVTESAGRDLTWLQRNCHDRIDEGVVALIIGQLSCALSYLHSHSIIHAYVCPDNILLNHHLHVSLSNFCRSILRPSPIHKARYGYIGSYPYTAPEFPRGENICHAIDWWSVGIVLYDMMYGKLPFKMPDDSPKDIASRMLFDPPVFPKSRHVSSACVQFITELLHKDPDWRLTCFRSPSLFCHEFFERNRINFQSIFTGRLVDPEAFTIHTSASFIRHLLPKPNEVVCSPKPKVMQDSKKVDDGRTGCKPNIAPKSAASKMQLAAYLGDTGTALQMLYEEGVEVNCLDSNNRTPLYWAVQKNQPHMVRLLLEHGADANYVINAEGDTITHMCIEHGSKDITRMLLKHVEDLDANKMYGASLLYHAMKRDEPDFIDDLVHKGARLTNLSTGGASIFHACALFNSRQCLRYLVTNCLHHGLIGLINLLIVEGRVEIRDQVVNISGWAALHIAVAKGHGDIVQLLVEYGASPDLETAKKHSPLTLALKYRRYSLIPLLLAGKHGAQIYAERGQTLETGGT